MFLKSRFEGPNLIVALRNEQGDVFAPLENFKMLFPLVVLLSLWIVLLLSIMSIRKSLFPLEKLKEGALRLARRDFDSRVSVNSHDEFMDLADTFNMSASALGRQFNAMEAMAEIDHTIHTSLNIQSIVNTALKRMCTFFSCNAIFLGLVNERKPDALQVFSYIPSDESQIVEEFQTVTSNDMRTLSEPFDYFLLDPKNDFPSYLPERIIETASNFIVMPLYHGSTFFGILCMGHKTAHSYSDDDLAHSERLSNQVALALSNAQLIGDLESLNWGTLEALARTVDAKSKWTAGHTERVAELSVKIARVMGCNDRAVDILHRAAFLHDIGKIGVPAAILDKPGKLSDEEYDKVKEHPVIGAKILEPIDAYIDTIPIILQHHERFDGKGYPQGISGEEITLGARILSVADVYDALISNRPYRQGWVEERVLKLLREESGRQFDPNVIDAFFSTISLSSNANLRSASSF
jgi:putative nucleotidyltransferase with HDIG domain